MSIKISVFFSLLLMLVFGFVPVSSPHIALGLGLLLAVALSHLALVSLKQAMDIE